MSRLIVAFTALATLALVLVAAESQPACPSPQEAQEGWVSIFNGRNLDGWTPKIRGQKAGEDPMRTFIVRDGAITVDYAGYDGAFRDRFGHLFYERTLSDYRLRFDYRFIGEQLPDGPGWATRNSGIMAHGQSPESMTLDQDFPVSIEVQLLGGLGQGNRTTMNLCTPGTNVVMNDQLVTQHCNNSSSETYHGDQWVSAELEVNGAGVVRHYLDGKLVLAYEQSQYDPTDGNAKPLIADGHLLIDHGTISLQSESAPVQFRNLRIQERPVTR